MDKFFIVWNPAGRTPPQTKFASLIGAKQAAAGLAARNPGQTFHVMELVASVVAGRLTWTGADDPDRAPF